VGLCQGEAEAIRSGVGLIDATAFTKHLVRGPGATAFLDHFTCNKLPKVGRINLTYALTSHGTTRTEYTIVRLAENEYYLVSAGAWTAYDADFLMKSAEDFMGGGGGWVDIHDVTTQWGVFAIAGPKSRDVLAEIVKDADPATVLGNKRFPWLSMREIELGMCPVRAIRVAYTGELGWELHHPIEMQNYLWDQLMAAGEKHGMKLVGARAQNWLRQEKSYRAFGTELGRDATPLEAGLDRFVDLDKEFHGKAKMVETGVRFKCVTVLIDGPDDADPWGREGLFADATEGRAPDLGRLFGAFRQADRHGLRLAGACRGWHEAEGAHVPGASMTPRWSRTAPMIRRTRSIRVDG
jgi:dimethylglycine dehydrogenase